MKKKPGPKPRSFEENKTQFPVSFLNKNLSKLGGIDKVKELIYKHIESLVK